MNTKSRLILPLAIGLVSLQGCGTVGNKTADTQPSAQEVVSIPVAVKKSPAAIPAATATPATPAAPTKAEAVKPGLVDRYTVVPGDSLAIIAAKQEVYGDARLWPLLSRANAHQIGPQRLIFPGQVLIVGRNHTQADIQELTGRYNKKPASPAPVVAVTPAASSSAPPAMPTTPADYLAGARQAFAAGDAAWSIYYYSIYLEHRNTDAGVWGELGNVHHFDGNFPEAATAFYNAANLLIDRGQTARALELMPAIEEGDPSLSAALYQRLTTIKQ